MCQRESEYYLTTVNAGPSEIDDLVQANDGLPRYFRIDTTGAKKSTDDLMKIALTDATAKALLIKLTLLGYPLYYNTENESRFIRSDRIRHHWPAIKEGTYSVTDEDVVYTFEKPASERIDKIIVIFSPINSTPRLSRYFWPSFSKLMKFVPPNTAILRIADVGGVKGAFYMDTTAQPRNGDAVHNLVAGIISEHSLENSDVVLFGASKGGTGAATTVFAVVGNSSQPTRFSPTNGMSRTIETITSRREGYSPDRSRRYSLTLYRGRRDS